MINNGKIPDLIFDLNVPNKNIRCALEIEKSRKALHRYDQLVLSYAQMSSIELVVIAYNDRYTEQGIKKSLQKFRSLLSGSAFAFCKIGDMAENPSRFVLSLNDNLNRFDIFVQNLKAMESAPQVNIKHLEPENAPELVPEKIPVNSGNENALK